MRVLLRLAYEGAPFHGSARQPDLRTVEGETEFALRKVGAIQDSASSHFLFASRTDAGVNALGNVVRVDTDFPPEGLVGAFNAVSREVAATGYAVAPVGFDPRHARSRWYRYLLEGDLHLPAWRRHATLFVGEHDFASFTKAPDETVRRIDRIDVDRDGDWTAFDVRAPGFLWNMVRRVVAAIQALAAGDAEEADVTAALRGERRIDLGMAAAPGLTLMAVEYDFPFRGGLDGARRESLRRQSHEARLRSRWLEDVLGNARGGEEARNPYSYGV